MLAGCAACATPWAHADTVTFEPYVNLEEEFTDNVFLTQSNRQDDFITRAIAGANIGLDGPRLTGKVLARAWYDLYANSPGASGVSVDANGQASYELFTKFLYLDAAGLLTNSYVSTFGTPADDRAGLPGRYQLSTYHVGPTVKTEIGDFEDLVVMARFAQIFFGIPPSSPTVKLPSNSSIYHVRARAGTGERSTRYEFVTRAEYERDDQGFQLYDAAQSAYVRIFPGIRFVARGGYDNVTQPGVLDISSPAWSAGFQALINKDSKFSAEGGQRFHRAYWTGNLRLQISDRLYATGNYDEGYEPEQVRLESLFSDYISDEIELPPQLAPSQFNVNGNLYDETSFSKLGQLHMVYSWELQDIDLAALWNDRRFFPSLQTDRVIQGSATYKRQLRRDLSAQVQGYYWRDYANPVAGQTGDIVYGSSETFGGAVSVNYALNSTMGLSLRYDYRRQRELFTGGATADENAVRLSVEKRF
ncbi:MAG TPA: TIGR03016 family PEP-CTERM system-associated outer membrane protein [Rhizomicrobium sp.]|nr:TIGR03016 family PEP-CTERM system-associated outer membrane protein [Rhizomicrobium sp.]